MSICQNQEQLEWQTKRNNVPSDTINEYFKRAIDIPFFMKLFQIYYTDSMTKAQFYSSYIIYYHKIHV